MPQPNIQNMLKQAQEAMAAQQEAQDALKEQRVEASAGGGMVKVVVTGDMKLEALTIAPDAVDPEDVEMLQDLVLAATNEALRQVMDLQEKAMQGASGAEGFDPMAALEGLGLGGALGGGGGLGGLGAGPGGPGGAPGMNRAARRAAAKKNR
jgi:DNA-binding YbaB/EbfC family protein